MTLLSLHLQYICYDRCRFFLPLGKTVFAVDLLKFFYLTFSCLVYLCSDNFRSLAADICSVISSTRPAEDSWAADRTLASAQFSFFTCSIWSENRYDTPKGTKACKESLKKATWADQEGKDECRPWRFVTFHWFFPLKNKKFTCNLWYVKGDIKNNWINNKHLRTLNDFITQSDTVLHSSAYLTEGNKWCRWKLHCQNALEMKINATKIITKLGEKVKMNFWLTFLFKDKISLSSVEFPVLEI